MNDRRIRRKTEMPEKDPDKQYHVIPKEIPNSFSLPSWIPRAITTDNKRIECPTPSPHNNSLIHSISIHVYINLR